ncbi:hypothetical protein ScPMuIL_009022 [Solemya velum]
MPTCMAYSCANTTGKNRRQIGDHVGVEWLTRHGTEINERCRITKIQKHDDDCPDNIFARRTDSPRSNTEQRIAKKTKDKMMDQLLHGPDEPSQASEEACLVAVEIFSHQRQKRPRPKSRCKWPTLVDAGTQTEVVIMCDGETQVERTFTTGVGTQWPEYEQNLLAEPVKCVLDHSYNAPVPVHSTPPKPSQQPAVYTCINISEQSVIDQDIDESAIDAEQSLARGGNG